VVAERSIIMPRKKFGKCVYAEVSEEFCEFLKKHAKDYESIKKALSDKVYSLLDMLNEVRKECASRHERIVELRREIRCLRECKGLDFSDYKIHSLFIPAQLIFDKKYSTLSLEAKFLFSVLLLFKGVAVSKGQVTKGNLLYLTETDVNAAIRLINDGKLSDSDKKRIINELVNVELLLHDFDDNGNIIYHLGWLYEFFLYPSMYMLQEYVKSSGKSFGCIGPVEDDSIYSHSQYDEMDRLSKELEE
jgi:hypothetical protein